MYRAVAVAADERGIPLEDSEELRSFVRGMKIDAREEGGVFRVSVDGEEMTDKIRGPRADNLAKTVSMIRPVREKLVEAQKMLAERSGVVMEGRDIGSVVIPDAEVKVFLTADVEERARRRWKELAARGTYVSFENVLEEMVARDQKDVEREWGKLVKTEDAVLIDSTNMSVDQVVEAIVKLCEVKASCSTPL